MQLLLVVIEKINDLYTAYSPNLLGVSVSAATREDVERQIVAAVEGGLAALQSRVREDAGRLELTLRPVEETVPCSFAKPDQQPWCELPPKKDGLCANHWRVLYGHAKYNRDPNSPCLLCGEKNKWELENWHFPCPVKAENPEWPALLAKVREGLKARRVERQRRAKVSSRNGTRR